MVNWDKVVRFIHAVGPSTYARNFGSYKKGYNAVATGVRAAQKGDYSGAINAARDFYNAAREARKNDDAYWRSQPQKRRKSWGGGPTGPKKKSRASGPPPPPKGPMRPRGVYRVQGVYRGRFKGRKVNYGFNGAIMRTEKGGLVEQDKCVYIGHAAWAHNKVVRIWSFAIMRKLAKLYGHDIQSFKDECMLPNVGEPHTGVLNVSYSSDEANELLDLNVNIAANQTWEGLADAFVTALFALVSGTTTHFRLHQMRIDVQTTAAPTYNYFSRKLNLNDATMTIEVTSELTLQNRTLANSGPNPEHNDSMLDIENNPLEGKSYFGSGTGFRPKYVNDYVGGGTFNFIADKDTSIIEADPDDATLTAEMQDLFQRPPLKFALIGAKSSTKVQLGPGELKRSFLKYRATKFVNSWLHIFLRQSRIVASQDVYQYVSKSRMFAFEKMMHTSDATEPDMSIGYEINNVYKAALKTRRQRVMMDKDVL